MSEQIINVHTSAVPGVAATSGFPVRVAKTRTRTATGRRLRDNLGLAGVYVFLGIMTLFALFPIYFVIQASLADTQTLYSTTLALFPSKPTLGNYQYVLGQTAFLHWIGNSLYVCSLSTVIGLFSAIFGAYALSRFRFKGRQMTLVALLALQAFPGLLALTAYYLLLQQIHLINTLEGLALVYGAGSIVFSIWNIKGYFDTLPGELEEAAIVDGASTLKTFWQIMLPLALPAIAASALLNFIGGWSEYALANLIITSVDATNTNYTFPLGMFSLQNDFRTPWGYFAAASVLASIPLMALFLWLQRYFQSGLTIGSVKG
jgi:arabinogalactan oligomer / maltooligosaccharide transport system permease protein